MCLIDYQDSRKSRRLLAIGCACLAIALPLRLLFHPSGETALNVLHLLVGLLMGVSIAFNLMAVIARKRSRENRA